MIVKDVMSKNIISVDENQTILDVCKIMRNKNMGFIVISKSNKAIGVITDRDIVLELSMNAKLCDKISSIMKKDLVKIDLNAEIDDASDLLGNMQIRRLIVINELDEIKGILSIADLARNILLENNALDALTEISYDFSSENDTLIHIETSML